MILWIKNDGTYDSWNFYRKKALQDAANKSSKKLNIIGINEVEEDQFKAANYVVVDSADIRKLTRIKEIRSDVKLIVISGDEEIASKLVGFNAAFADLNIFYLQQFAEKYNEFNNIFLLPEAADYRSNQEINTNKLDGAIYIGSAYPARIKIINETNNVHVYGSEKWKRICPSKYRGKLESAVYYEKISSYRSALCLMELDNDVPHLNAKIFDAIVAGTIPIVPKYAPFTDTYKLPIGCYFEYNHHSEINKIIQIINEMDKLEYKDKIDKLRRSQNKFSYELQYYRLIKSFEDIENNEIREWTRSTFFGLRINKRIKIINRLTKIMIQHKEEIIPVAVQFLGLLIPSRFSPIYLNSSGRIKLKYPVIDSKCSLLNLPVIKIG